MTKISYRFVYVVMIVTFAGCATKNTDRLLTLATEANLPQVHAQKEYEFQVGDVFDVKFFENPDLDQSVIVRPDGRISLPLVEDLLVVGMTPTALDEIITDKYREKIKEPEVTIILRQFAGQRVYVGGEVNNPGVLQLTARMTLLQSIFHGGGFKRSAKLDSVIVIRNKNNKAELYRVDVDEILYEGGNDLALKPYDVVFVPKTFIAKADDFVDQYINQIIPEALRFGFNFVYSLDRRDRDITIIAE
jgi:protein involved in polysaccharide export with SLBB domain